MRTHYYHSLLIIPLFASTLMGSPIERMKEEAIGPVTVFGSHHMPASSTLRAVRRDVSAVVHAVQQVPRRLLAGKYPVRIYRDGDGYGLAAYKKGHFVIVQFDGKPPFKTLLTNLHIDYPDFDPQFEPEEFVPVQTLRHTLSPKAKAPAGSPRSVNLAHGSRRAFPAQSIHQFIAGGSGGASVVSSAASWIRSRCIFERNF
jgi:hypothetical protein